MLPTEKNVPNRDVTKLRVTLYGPPKVGKSTFATRNPKAIVLDTDSNGTEFIDCFRVPIADWTTLKLTLGELANDQSGRFDTVIIDTVERAHQMCREQVCIENGIKHESEDKAFGRVWDLVKNEFNRMIGFIQKINKGLWMVSHSIQKEVKIDGVKRTIVTPNLSDKVSRVVCGLSDVIAYMDFDENGKRKLFITSQEGIECGDRTKVLTENIVFDNEEQLYSTIVKKFDDAKGAKK